MQCQWMQPVDSLTETGGLLARANVSRLCQSSGGCWGAPVHLPVSMGAAGSAYALGSTGRLR